MEDRPQRVPQPRDVPGMAEQSPVDCYGYSPLPGGSVRLRLGQSHAQAALRPRGLTRRIGARSAIRVPDVTIPPNRQRQRALSRSSQPRRDRSPVARQCGPQHGSVGGHSFPIEASGRDDDPAGDDAGGPTSALGDLARQAQLPVERAEELVHVNHVRLQLDHEQRTSRPVPGKGVNHAPFAVDGERDLRAICQSGSA